MTVQFRPAARENVPLLIGLAGGTGSGKTWSAMALATGLADGKRFAVIDTENGRAKHYADEFAFDVADLHAPFRPDRYADAIQAADQAGYPVIVVDSMSHEHAGDGGLLDWHEEEYQRLGGRDAVKMTAWIKPKMAHKAMVTRLLQVRAHLILAFRAEEKLEQITGDDGKKKWVPKQSLTGLGGWIPVSEKNLPYELTASLLLTADRPGVPRPIKLPEKLRAMVPLDQPLDEQVGARLRDWAAGGKPAENGAAKITTEQRRALFEYAAAQGLSQAAVRKVVEDVTGGTSTAQMTVAQLDRVRARIAEPSLPGEPDNGPAVGSAGEAGAEGRAAPSANQPDQEGGQLFEAPPIRPDRETGE